jgi:putative ABC transport system permease protein
VNPNLAFTKTPTMQQLVTESLGERRFVLSLLGAFASLALVLAVVGIYGLVSFQTSQRTHEIGVRMALGAQTRDVLRLVVGDSFKLAALGLLLGAAAAIAAAGLLQRLLFEVQPRDIPTYAIATAVLAFVALLASYIPARRATKVDPMVALRYE